MAVESGIELFRRALLGDVNGDGNQDLVAEGDGVVAVLLGDGHGHFTGAPGSPFVLGGSPWLLLADVNGDGRTDLVIARAATGDAVTLLSNGDGTFSASARPPSPLAVEYWTLAAGDVDHDGRADLVGTDARRGQLVVALGDGQGGFSAISHHVPTGLGSVALGDIDGDGHLDIVTARTRRDDLTVLLGNGGGGFVPAPFSPLYVGPQTSFALADMNADRRLDIVTAHREESSVSVLLRNGSAFSRAAGSPVTVEYYPDEVTVGDLDGNGYPDVLARHFSSDGGSIQLLLGSGTGRLTVGAQMRTAFPTQTVAVGDVDHDGRAEVVVGSRYLDVLRAYGAGTFASWTGLLDGLSLEAVATGDLDGDGRPDAVTVSQATGLVSVLLADGRGGLAPSPHPPSSVGVGAHHVVLGDLNADGNLDVLAASRAYNGGIAVLLGHGNGAFSPARGSPFAMGRVPRFVALGDVDGDGRLDVVAAPHFGGPLMVLLGDGTGHLSLLRTISPYSILDALPVDDRTLCLADVDGDRKTDILTLGTSALSVLRGDGHGGFGAPSLTSTGTHALHSLVAADLDGDGHLDVSFVDSFDNLVTVLLGDGRGRFSPAPGSPFPVTAQPIALAESDINGDGMPDLICAHLGGEVAVLLGSGGGAFQNAPGSPFTVPGHVMAVAVRDMDGDGRPDVLTAGGGLVSVLRNDGAWTSEASATTTTLVVTPASPALGEPLLLTARVHGTGTPSGSVTFRSRQMKLGARTLSDGLAILPSSLVFFGYDCLTASYSGDPQSQPSLSSEVCIYGGRAPSAAAFSATPNPAAAGSDITLRATLTPSISGIGRPGGHVTFRDGETTLGTASVSNGLATFRTATLSPGFHDLTATYDGDSDFQPARSGSISLTVTPARGACDGGDPHSLCLVADRFRARVSWQSPYPPTTFGEGTALPLSAGSGAFWFFDPAGVDLAVKILDGRAVNDRFWVLIGGLTDVAYTLSIDDLLTSSRRVYVNPPRQLGSFIDLVAFSSARSEGQVSLTAIPGATTSVAWPLPRAAAPAAESLACTTGGSVVCLGGGRFEVGVTYVDPEKGGSGAGSAATLARDTGAFRLFDSTNIELVVRVLDGRAINGRFWFLYGALTDVAYSITVTDTVSKAVKTYVNLAGRLGSRIDPEAF